MKLERELEHDALQRQFDCLAGRWCLTGPEVEALLGDQDAKAREHASRVLVEIDRLMGDLIGGESIPAWLRDDQGTGLAPLRFMSLGREERSAMLAAARLRHSEVIMGEPG
ncbi:hypothetical protein E3U23_07480 [Erythrobacter litoralis]|uniref:hypothetical protein n=1 Tax=Erythrobacter litoralis TaxID=39960 RepID=UPI0024351B5B|nr:hypothetical protein [Erythrobacter litoralis]MDG6079031.1 hypothetical protein [Erythrobacter litoralis]